MNNSYPFWTIATGYWLSGLLGIFGIGLFIYNAYHMSHPFLPLP